MVAIFALVLAITTSLWFALPATLCSAQGGYGVVGGGGGALPLHTSYTTLYGKIIDSGIVIEDVIAKSPDNLCQLTINKGTKALKKTGYFLSAIIMVEMEEPPTPPPNANVIGLAYDLIPDGATFDPPAPMTLTYDPALIPEDVAEKNLVIAMWNEEAGEWINLASTVDPATNTITASVSHFTVFTVIAYTQPAAFETSYLTVLPREVDLGEKVTIGVKVTNTGDLSESYEVTLRINNVVEATQEVTLEGGASQKVTFTTSKDVAGTYNVNVKGLSGTFTVKAAPVPAPLAPVPALPTPAPAPPVAPPPTVINWWLIGGIIAAVIVISTTVILLIRRRQA